MASGSQQAIRSVELRAGEFDNAGGQYIEYPGLESISGRWEGKRTTCTATAFGFSIAAWGVLSPAVYSHVIDESINNADT